MITDNGKEFHSGEFRKMCRDRGVAHNTVGEEFHKSNGRIKRAIATLREALMKVTEGTLEDIVARIDKAYNETYNMRR